MATRDQVYIDIITETKKSIGNLKSLVTGLAAAYAAFKTVQQIAKIALDAAMYAAKIEQISRAFGSMARAIGQDGESVIASIDRLAGGTINKLDLLTSASRAALFKLPIDKMDELMQIARASATATGESVKYMFDSIVLGIARGSPKILDNLGILIDATKANQDYAESIGKSADELTAAEQTQATMNAVLKAGKEILEGVGDVGQEVTDAQRWDVLTAAVANLKAELGEGLLPAFRETTKQATKLVDKLTEMARLNRILSEIYQGTATLKDELFAVNTQLEEYNLTIEKSGAAAEMMQQMLGGEIEALRNRKAALEDLIKRQEYQAALEEDIKARRRKALQDEIDRATELQEYLKEVQEAYAKTKEGQREALEAAIAHWEGHLKTAKVTAPEIIAIIAALKKDLADMDVTGEGKDPWSERVKSMNAATEAALEYYNLRQEALLVAERERAAIAAELAARESLLDLGATALEAVQASTQAHNERHAIIMQNLAEERDAVDETKEKYRELTEQQEQMAAIATAAFTAFGQAFADTAISCGEIFKEAMKAGVASAVQSLAMLAMAEAGIALAQLNFAKAAALFAAGTFAFAAAAGIRALGAGGIVTSPTAALIGERGPEAVIPLSKAGMMGGITLHVHGSLITEGDLLRAIESRVMGRLTRVY